MGKSGKELRETVDNCSEILHYEVLPYIKSDPKLKNIVDAVLNELDKLFYAIELEKDYQETD